MVKLSNCNFGGPGTNGLKWMGLLACSALRDQNYQSMWSNSKLPISSDLHLLLSASTVATAAPTFGSLWATNMIVTSNGVAQTVENAWYNAGLVGYLKETNHITITLRVAGWPNAFPEHINDVGATPGLGMLPTDVIEKHKTVFSNP